MVEWRQCKSKRIESGMRGIVQSGQPFDINSAAKNHKREEVSYSSSPTDLRPSLPDPFTFLITGHRRKETSIITALSILWERQGRQRPDPHLNGSITTSQQRPRIKENQAIDPHSSSAWIKKDTTACQLNINGFPVAPCKRSFVKCHSPKKIDADFKFGFRQEVVISHSCFYSRLWAPLKAPQRRLNCKTLFQIASFITFLWV